jgi:hypothetical protein
MKVSHRSMLIPELSSGGTFVNTRSALFRWRAAFAGAAMTALCSVSAASADSIGLDVSAQIVSQPTDETFGFQRGSVIVALIPFESPSLERGLAFDAAYLFQLNEMSDTSTIGFGCFRTANGSEGYGVVGSVKL